MGVSMETKTSVSGFSKPHHEADHAPVTSILPDGDVPYTDHDMDADERVITALGYKQEFKREFSLWTTFCVSFAVLGLLPSFASTLYYGECSKVYLPIRWASDADLIQGMGYAGTAGMVWGWIIAMIFIQCIAMSMAELCSAMPTRFEPPACYRPELRLQGLISNTVADYTTPQQFSHLPDTDHSPLG
jgi:hypothetical protein